MYLYALAVMILATGQTRASSILTEVRDICNSSNNVWTKVRNQTIIDPDRNVKQPEPLSVMLQQDLTDIDEIAKNMFRKIKTAIMCRSLRYFMPIVKLTTLVFVTVMSNRENAESTIRESTLIAAQNAKPSISDKVNDIIPKYLPTQPGAGQELIDNLKNEMENPEEAHEFGSVVGNSALEAAAQGLKEESFKKDVKLAAALQSSVKAKEVIGAAKFKKDLMNYKFERKTADEKQAYKDQFKKKTEADVDDGDEAAEDIEQLLVQMVVNPTDENANEDPQAQMFKRVAGKEAMKSRKNVIKSVTDTAIEAVMTAISNIEPWAGENEAAFFQQHRENIKKGGKSKVLVLEALKGISNPMLDLYYKECDCNLNVRLYEDFDRKIAQAINEEGEHSVADLMSYLNILSLDLQQELTTLPAEWKDANNFILKITGT